MDDSRVMTSEDEAEPVSRSPTTAGLNRQRNSVAKDRDGAEDREAFTAPDPTAAPKSTSRRRDEGTDGDRHERGSSAEVQGSPDAGAATAPRCAPVQPKAQPGGAHERSRPPPRQSADENAVLALVPPLPEGHAPIPASPARIPRDDKPVARAPATDEAAVQLVRESRPHFVRSSPSRTENEASRRPAITAQWSDTDAAAAPMLRPDRARPDAPFAVARPRDPPWPQLRLETQPQDSDVDDLLRELDRRARLAAEQRGG
jgi:hypothetical protein